MQKAVRWIAAISITLGVLLPVVPQIIWSFAHRWLFPNLLPTEWSLSSWEYVFTASSRVGEGEQGALVV